MPQNSDQTKTQTLSNIKTQTLATYTLSVIEHVLLPVKFHNAHIQVHLPVKDIVKCIIKG